jgi:hypothetical protein
MANRREQVDVVEHVRKMGARLRAKFEALAKKSPTRRPGGRSIRRSRSA